jgi:hypothetical protein
MTTHLGLRLPTQKTSFHTWDAGALPFRADYSARGWELSYTRRMRSVVRCVYT